MINYLKFLDSITNRTLSFGAVLKAPVAVLISRRNAVVRSIGLRYDGSPGTPRFLYICTRRPQVKSSATNTGLPVAFKSSSAA